MESRANNVLIAMMMLAVILLVWNRATHAALESTQQAYELDSTQIERWPLDEVGSLVLKPCDSCESVVLSVTPDTRYMTGFRGPNITLPELLALKTKIGGRKGTFVYIFYRTADNSVARFVLDVK